MPAQDIVIYGSYTVNKYNLSYFVDNLLYKEYSVDYGTTITPESYPVKEGHSFSGWNGLPETMPAHDVEVNGYFSINSYNAIFMIDDTVLDTVTVVYNEPITVPTAPEKEGHSFDGWNDVPDRMPAQDIVIYGSYTVNKYLITYIVEEEIYATDSVDYNAEIIAPEGPSREGYTFAWNDVPSVMPANDITIYGDFSVNSYDLIYIVDDVEYRRYTLEFGDTIVPEEEPVKEGYNFSGWSEIPETMPAHDVEVVGSFSTGINEIDYNNSNNVRKIFYDNQIYIIRNSRVFNIHGVEIKDDDIKEKLGVIE